MTVLYSGGILLIEVNVLAVTLGTIFSNYSLIQYTENVFTIIMNK